MIRVRSACALCPQGCFKKSRFDQRSWHRSSARPPFDAISHPLSSVSLHRWQCDWSELRTVALGNRLHGNVCYYMPPLRFNNALLLMVLRSLAGQKVIPPNANAAVIKLLAVSESMICVSAQKLLRQCHVQQRFEGLNMQWFLHRDGTATTKDILSVVASISYSKSQHQELRPGDISRSRMLQTMKAARHYTNTTQRILSLRGRFSHGRRALSMLNVPV